MGKRKCKEGLSQELFQEILPPRGDGREVVEGEFRENFFSGRNWRVLKC